MSRGPPSIHLSCCARARRLRRRPRRRLRRPPQSALQRLQRRLLLQLLELHPGNMIEASVLSLSGASAMVLSEEWPGGAGGLHPSMFACLSTPASTRSAATSLAPVASQAVPGWLRPGLPRRRPAPLCTASASAWRRPRAAAPWAPVAAPRRLPCAARAAPRLRAEPGAAGAILPTTVLHRGVAPHRPQAPRMRACTPSRLGGRLPPRTLASACLFFFLHFLASPPRLLRRGPPAARPHSCSSCAGRPVPPPVRVRLRSCCISSPATTPTISAPSQVPRAGVHAHYDHYDRFDHLDHPDRHVHATSTAVTPAISAAMATTALATGCPSTATTMATTTYFVHVHSDRDHSVHYDHDTAT